MIAREELVIFEDGSRGIVDVKYAFPERYREEQAELQKAYQQGKKYYFKTVYKKTCPICRDAYYCTNKQQIYCSGRCKNNARKHKEERMCSYCAYCGKPFTTVRMDAQYCSNKCRQAVYRYRKQHSNNAE